MASTSKIAALKRKVADYRLSLEMTVAAYVVLNPQVVIPANRGTGWVPRIQNLRNCQEIRQESQRKNSERRQDLTKGRAATPKLKPQPKGRTMTFLDRALPYAKLGIPVFPLEPREKIPAYGLNWDSECTTDPVKINRWNDVNPEYNCGLVATHDGVFFLEFDQGSLEEEAQHLGVSVPETRVHLSGKNGKHWVFVQNDRSREISNRSAVAKGEEWFSMRADTKYVVAPGSIHPITGKEYTIINDVLPSEAPDWVLDFVHALPTRANRWSRSNSKAPHFLFPSDQGPTVLAY